MPQINAKTIVCAVIGHPIGHSLSPELHNAAFAALGLPFVYVAHDVQPGHVPRALEGIRALGYRGLSVTIPHKVEAMHCVDEVDETARGIGCINTVLNEGGRLLGYNSDGRGALNALREAGADPSGRRVLLLGSGGAARAIAITLVREAPPAQLTILGVVVEELARLVQDTQQRGQAPVSGQMLADDVLRSEISAADIVLHCTPLGMHPHDDQCLVPAALWRAGTTVFDAVYNPRRTRLLREAQAAGCRVVEGIEMFLGQAYVQFELWTGQPAPRAVMRRVLEERL
jgi:shikimate dehydrogenase